MGWFHYKFRLNDNNIVGKINGPFSLSNSLKQGLIDPQGGRGHVTAILSCTPSKIQTRWWFVTNYSNISYFRLATTVHIEVLLFLA